MYKRSSLYNLIFSLCLFSLTTHASQPSLPEPQDSGKWQLVEKKSRSELKVYIPHAPCFYTTPYRGYRGTWKNYRGGYRGRYQPTRGYCRDYRGGHKENSKEKPSNSDLMSPQTPQKDLLFNEPAMVSQHNHPKIQMPRPSKKLIIMDSADIEEPAEEAIQWFVLENTDIVELVVPTNREAITAQEIEKPMETPHKKIVTVDIESPVEPTNKKLIIASIKKLLEEEDQEQCLDTRKPSDKEQIAFFVTDIISKLSWSAYDQKMKKE